MLPRVDVRFRLVATDLDGTLLHPDGNASTRAVAALHDIQAAGIFLVLVTGRPLRTLRPLADDLRATSLAICYNGALVYDLGQCSIVEHTPCMPDVIHTLIVALREVAPGVCFAFELGERFGCEPGYLEMNPRITAREIILDDALTLSESPVTKLIVRHPTMPRDALMETTRALGGLSIVATHSGAPFVEVSAAGVDKASALQALCSVLGVDKREVLAFGDMPNDVAMLIWAGHGVAVANAHPEALQAADAIAPSNLDDGVAAALERLLCRQGN